MGLKKGMGSNGISSLRKRLTKMKTELPQVLDHEVRAVALEMAETAINMAPTYTNLLRNSIKYKRTGGERNSKGQYVKGGLGIHIVELNLGAASYFERVHSEMSVGRDGSKFQPSEHSIETAAAAGEVAGGLFMERSRQKYAFIIPAKLGAKAQKYIKAAF